VAALLRPLAVGEILDGAFTLYRRNFGTFFAIALIPQLPLIAMWLLLPAFLGEGMGGAGVVEAATLLALPYSLLATLIVWAGISYATYLAYDFAPPSAAQALGLGVRRMFALLVAGIIVWLLVTLGFLLLIIPGLIALAMFMLIVPVIAIEDAGPFEALGRSRRISKGGRLRILGVAMLATLIAFLPVMAVSMLVGASLGVGAMLADAEALAESGWAGGLFQAFGNLVSALTTPFSAAAITLLYIDRRARTEAPDLEERLERLAEQG
jgi:hypothetical protein